MVLNKDGIEESISRISGFKLDTEVTENKVNTQLYREMVEEAMNDRKMEVPVNQLRKSVPQNLIEPAKQKMVTMNLRNNLCKKRVIKTNCHSTLPFGYTSEMMSELQIE